MSETELKAPVRYAPEEMIALLHINTYGGFGGMQTHVSREDLQRIVDQAADKFGIWAHA